MHASSDISDLLDDLEKNQSTLTTQYIAQGTSGELLTNANLDLFCTVA